MAAVHFVDTEQDAKIHYDQKLTESSLIIQGKGHLELDVGRVAAKPMTAVRIKPGCWATAGDPCAHSGIRSNGRVV